MVKLKSKKLPIIMIIALVILGVATAGVLQQGQYSVSTSPSETLDSSPDPTATPDSPAPSITTTPNSTPKPAASPSTTTATSTTSTSTPTPTVSISIFGSDPSKELLNIEWGAINILETKNYTINVVNSGNAPVILGLSVSNWTVGVEGTISWDYDGRAIASQATKLITLSLIIENANVTSFSNNIVLSAQNA
jgi:hypothetical protein